MRISDLEKYKHDTIGKFPILKGFIDGFEEHDFAHEDNAVIFQAVHEVLIKMVTTSKKMMEGPLKQGASLTVCNGEADLALKRLDLPEVSVRYKLTQGRMDYFYYPHENSGDHSLNIEKLKLVLPIIQVCHPKGEV
jgi:hypothetical protein